MKISTQIDYLANKMGLETGLRTLCEAGYDCLDFSFFSVGIHKKENRQELAHLSRSIADEYGKTFNQAHFDLWGYTSLQDILPSLEYCLECCCILGVKQLVVHGIQNGPYIGHESECRERNIAFYRQLKPFASEYGVKIAIENLWRQNQKSSRPEADIFSDPNELAWIFDSLDSDCFTVLLDTGHAAITGHEPEDCIRILGKDRLGGLHVHDVDYLHDSHTLPGIGKINWKNVSCALREIGYQGEFTLEADAFFRGFEPDFYPEVASFMVKRARSIVEMKGD